ncbi:MAG: PH domain-containing protein [Patescibacteria group bacterium]
MNNKKIIKSLNLQPGEKIVLVVRRYSLIYWWQIALVFIFLLLPFFLLYPLFRWATWGPIIFCLLLAIGLYWGLRLLAVWYFNCLVVTNQRLADFDQRGFFNRTVSETVLTKVEDIAYQRKGVWQSIFNYGLIKYTVPPGRTMIEVRGIKRPQQVYQAIMTFINQQLPDKKELSASAVDSVEKLRNLLLQLKQELGDENFQQVIKELGRGEESSALNKRSQEIDSFWQKK